MIELVVILFFLILAFYGWLGAIESRDTLSWFVGVFFRKRKAFYGVGILKRGAQLPPYGSWGGEIGFVVIGAPPGGYRLEGEFYRKGRIVLFKSVPRKVRTKFKPDFSFG